MRALALCVLLAACDDGLVLEIHPVPGTKPATVDIYMGVDRCTIGDTDCPGIRPPGASAFLPGDVFDRDTDQTYTVPVDSDGVARVKLLPSTRGANVPVVVAVDDTWSSAAIAVDIDTSKVGKRRMDLRKSTGFLGTQQPDGTYLQIWAQAKNPEARCLGFEYWSTNGDKSRDLTRYFVVPREDPDCDEHVDRTTGECNPLEFNGVQLPTLDTVTCTTLVQTSTPDEICKLGGPLCIDGEPGSTSTCNASDYCIPTAYCPPCQGVSGTQAIRSCVANAARSSSAPHLECTLPVEKSADGTHYDPCGNNFAELDAKALLHHCQSAPVLLAKPLDAATTSLRFVDETTLTTGDNNLLQLKIRLAHDCTYETHWDGQVAIEGPIEPTFARFAVGNVGSPPQFLLMPVVLSTVTDCSKSISCKFAGTPVNNADLYRCAPPL